MKARGGYTLVEVIVAMLLAAVMITAIFTVALSNKRSSQVQDNKHMAQVSAHGFIKVLSAYVTADWQQSAVAAPNQIKGPNSLNAGMATWNLHSSAIEDVTQGAVWALMPGSHTIRGFAAGSDPEGFLARLRGPPYNGTLTYCVQWIGCAQCSNNTNCSPGTCTPPLGPTCQPQISVEAKWTQP